MLDQNLPVYMSEDSLKLYRRLEACGDIQVKGHKNCIGISYGESFNVGDITVEVEAIDHDRRSVHADIELRHREERFAIQEIIVSMASIQRLQKRLDRK